MARVIWVSLKAVSFACETGFTPLPQIQLLYSRMEDHLPPEFEAFFESRRKREKPALLQTKDGQVLTKGEFRSGSEGDEGEIFYPRPQQALPDEQLALAAWIQIEGGDAIRIRNARHCWNGTTVHLHFERA